MAIFLADLVVLLHLVFILFVLFGGVLVDRWPGSAWLHVPSVAWGILISFKGWPCPLTVLEKWLRDFGGGTPYATSFVRHYLVGLVYPAGLGQGPQVSHAVLLLIANAFAYAWVLHRQRDKAR